MATLALAYAHLNLRRNPFGELAPREAARLAVVDLERATALLRAGSVVQLVAPPGHGKTTHLLALQWEASLRGELRCVDEIERLAPAARLGLWRAPGALAVATHADLSPEIRRAGRSVGTLPVGRLTRERLTEMIERRIEAARRAPGIVPRVPPATVASLLRGHGDDVRAIFAALYEAFQDLPEVNDVSL
jgi:hypothetical protein